jgi:hypothetical protein
VDSELRVSVNAIAVLNQVKVLRIAILISTAYAVQGAVRSSLVIVAGEKDSLA